MIKAKHICAKTRGNALLMVIVVCLICAIVGVGLLSLSFNARMIGIRSGADISARCAADAAIAHAVFQMNEKLKVKPWDDSSLPSISNMILPNCDATCNYTVSNIGGNYVINATGRANHGIRNIKGTLRIKSVFDYALFAKDSLELKNSATVDWYNNQPDDWPLQIGTNSITAGAITFMSSTTINGDVLVGVGGNPSTVIDAKSGVTITGSAYAIFSNVVLPSIAVPAWLDAMTDSGNIKNDTTLSSSGKYTSIDLGNSEVLDINEPVFLYITTSITLGNNAKIVIGDPNLDPDNDASLTIYLAGDFEGKNGSSISNLTADAKRFTLYGLDACASIVMKNGSNFYGAIYAPNTSIDMDNSASTYGSVIGESFILKNSGTFYYDANLRDRTVNDEAIRFTVQRWGE
jgi:hypothetical protein